METTSRLSPELEQLFRSALDHLLAGRPVEAEAIYRRILQERADSPGVCHNLGVALKSQRKSAEAIAAFHQALALRPAYPEAYSNLGDTLRELNQPVQALEALRAAVAIRPDFPEALNNMGMVLRNLGRLDEALEVYRRALAQRPGFAEAWSNMGNLLREMKRISEAIEAYRRAVTLRPAFPEAWNNLGGTLRQANRVTEALDAYRQALKLNPGKADVWSNLGIALRDSGQFMEALEVFRRSLAMQDDQTGAWINLAVTLKDTGQVNEALSCYERVMKLQPGHAEAAGGRLCTIHYHPGYDAAAIYQETRRWNDQFARPLAPAQVSWSNDPSPQRRLRIGYVSPDFRGHCQSLFTVPLLRNHDHERYEIYGYSNTQDPDAVSARLRSHADFWHDITDWSDAQAAEAIRKDQIDILVDLALHTAGNRLGIFARKPAPIQVTWLGYPGTTGLDAIDYRLTDACLDPPDSEVGSQESGRASGACPHAQPAVSTPADSDHSLGIQHPYYSERSVYLDDGYWCYDPRGMEANQAETLPQPGPLPALKTGHVTLGCLNNFCKINDMILELWAGVMAALPTAHLLLVAPPGLHRERLIKKLGVNPERVQFVVYQPRGQYLETYQRIDLCLDTLPFNGGTTSLDALWMGVPVLTRLGRTVVGRAGSSHLHQLGLEDLIAKTDQEFIDLAGHWTGDLNKLSALRGTLRSRMEQSTLMDGKRFARNMESAYRQMWQTWCRARG